MKELQNYEFMDPEAQHKFTELMEMLKKAMTETFFKDMYDQIANMSPEDMARMKQMVKDLNQMLSDRMAGGEPDFDEVHGAVRRPLRRQPAAVARRAGRAACRRQMAQMQNLLDSLPGDMRQQLQDLLSDKVGDPDLQAELQELQMNLEFLSPMRDMRNQYPFRGDEEIDLNEAMGLMDQMQSMDELERQLERTQYGGDIDDIDEEKLKELLGEEAARDAGPAQAVPRDPRGGRLHPQEGQQLRADAARHAQDRPEGARRDLLAAQEATRSASTQIRDNGRGGERADDTKKYEFGDPFHLALDKTIMNSLQREGRVAAGAARQGRLRGLPLGAAHADGDRDDGRPLVVDGAARLVPGGEEGRAGAEQPDPQPVQPRQPLHHRLLGLRARAEGGAAAVRALGRVRARHEHAPRADAGAEPAREAQERHAADHHDLATASRRRTSSAAARYFAYPPSPITIRETLKEVKRATQKGITINTFMLDRNYYLKEFVNQVAKINKGRVFYTTPDKLGAVHPRRLRAEQAQERPGHLIAFEVSTLIRCHTRIGQDPQRVSPQHLLAADGRVRPTPAGGLH